MDPNTFGKRFTKVCKYKKDELGKKVNVHDAVIGSYDRNEVKPSIEMAKALAEVLEVSLDYLVNENAVPTFDKKTVNHLKDIQHLNEVDKKHVFALLDAFLDRTKIKSIVQ